MAERRSAAVLGFVLGDAVAGGYDGWSRPPTSAAVDIALRDAGPLQGTERTQRLLSAIRRGGADAPLVGPRGQPAALVSGIGEPGHFGENGASTSPSQVADDIVVTGVAAGIMASSPARAAEAARNGVPTDGATSPLALGDAAGVIAAALGLALADRLPPSPHALADEVVTYAHTAEVREQLYRVGDLHPVPPAPAVRGLVDEPGPVYLVGVVLLAAGSGTTDAAVRWAARTGRHPGPASAAAGALAAARDPATIATARAPSRDILAEIGTLLAPRSPTDEPGR